MLTTIEDATDRLRFLNARRHRKGVGSIPAGGAILDEFFSTVIGLNFNMCMISKTYLPFRNHLASSGSKS